MSSTDWYWCLTHERPELGIERDDPDNSLGPYDSEADARNWKLKNEERAAAWKAQDEEWNGKDEADDDDA